MNRRPDPAATRRLERNAFFILLGVLTIGLAWVISPFYGAVFWGAVLALMIAVLPQAAGALSRPAQPGRAGDAGDHSSSSS